MASATGIGSMPGTDPEQAAEVIMAELSEFPHLAELPARGPGAELTGRTAALLVDLPTETTAVGWKFAARAGRDQRRALAYLSADLDAAQEAADGYAGAYKIQACGPWTLAASIELPGSVELALIDPGAVADIVASLAEGLAVHVAEVRKRIPGADLVVQLDEPALPAVLAGTVPTASGLRAVAAIEESAVISALGAVASAAAAFTVVHCCAPRVSFSAMKQVPVGAVSFDLGVLDDGEIDAVAELADCGLGLLVGVATGRPARQIAADAVGLWRKMGLGSAGFAGQVVITPSCGLVGEPPERARSMLAACREAGRIAAEMIEEGAGD